MGFLSVYSKPTRLDLGDGWWIDIRPYLSHDEYETAQREAGLVQQSLALSKDAEVSVQMDVGKYMDHLVCAAICGWNLTDENDQPLPLSPPEAKLAAVRRLPEFAYALVRGSLDKERTPAEQATFRDPSAGGAAGAGDGAADLPEVRTGG